jgi:hypothetical protein
MRDKRVWPVLTNQRKENEQNQKSWEMQASQPKTNWQ